MMRLLAPVRDFLARKPAAGPDPVRLIDLSATGTETIYAVGDVHGEARLLGLLTDMIEADASAFPGRKILIFLGDYLDRGPQTAQVVDTLIRRRPAGFEVFHLFGNHEQMFLDFLSAPHPGHNWLRHGGIETLASYGISTDLRRTGKAALSALLASHIPDEHVTFLKALPDIIVCKDMIFVHAGIRPDVPLGRQARQDVLWIRDGFLDQELDSTRTVVHGHTPSASPVVAPGRIGIDTGAYASGQLTAVRLRGGETPQFLSTRSR